MRQTAPTWAKTLLSVLLLAHLLIHPSLHVVAPLAGAPVELSAPGEGEGDAAPEGRAPCLACRIGSSILVSTVAAEPLAPNSISEPVSLPDASFDLRPTTSTRPSRAPPLAV